MNIISARLMSLRLWLDSLQQRERIIVIAGAISLAVILFYLLIWEPIKTQHEEQLMQQESQRQLLQWMKNARLEIQSLRSVNAASISRFRNLSISNLADRSATSSGIKTSITKIEQGKNGTRVDLKSVDFDRMIRWLSDLQNTYGIHAARVKVEHTSLSGAVNAEITLQRKS